MRDASYQLRVATAAALQDAGLTVYDMYADDNAVFPRIILNGVSALQTNFNKCGFVHDYNQSIKVTQSFAAGATSNTVDQLTDQILSILAPFNVSGYLVLPDFNIWRVNTQIVGTLQYTDGVRKYIDKNLNIVYSITEK